MQRALYDPKCNSFHLIRLIFALLVVLTHAYTTVNAAAPLTRLTGGQLSEGTIAVDGFLVISGFLIAQSAARSKSAAHFLRNRFLRIYPALICAVIFTALLVGGLAYGGTYHDYLRIGVDGPLYYIRHWLTLNFRGEPWGIRGVFAANPTQGVNVSLWTIKHEISLYLLVAALMICGLHRKKGVYAAFAGIFAVLFVLLEGLGVQLWSIMRVEAWVVNHWNYAHFVRTGLFFFLGATMYHYQAHLPQTWWFALLTLAALIGSAFVGLLPWVHVALGPYLIVRLCCLRTFDGARRLGDLSFGVYVYSYPVQQLILSVWPTMHPMMNLAASLAIVLPIAWWSWKRIESPALQLKAR